MLLILLALVLLVTGCQPVSEPSDETSPTTLVEGTQVGNLAPGFQLQNLDGEVVSLSGLRGRPVMLNFWASWCGPCRYEMPFIQEIYEEWTGKPPSVVVLAINVGESASTAKNFMQSYNLSFPVLLDTRKDVTRKYNIIGYPTTFFIDKNGIIQGKVIGAFQNKGQIEQHLSTIVP